MGVRILYFLSPRGGLSVDIGYYQAYKALCLEWRPKNNIAIARWVWSRAASTKTISLYFLLNITQTFLNQIQVDKLNSQNACSRLSNRSRLYYPSSTGGYICYLSPDSGGCHLPFLHGVFSPAAILG